MAHVRRSNRTAKQFGKAIRDRREHKGISQEQLGELAGLHRTYIGALERGEKRPTIDTMGRVAKALGLRLSALLAIAEHADG